MPLPLPTDFTGPNITEAQFKTAMTNLVNYLAALETIPVGAVVAFAMSTPPTGFLKANGAAISRTAYSALFAKIGTTYGAGNGSTTFNVPDLRGEFVRGWDDGRGVDSGRALGSSQGGAIQSHTHPISLDAAKASISSLGSMLGRNGSTLSDQITISATAGASGDAETRPRNIALLACIKY